MKACRLAIIVAAMFSALNALALQTNNSCSDCGDQPPRFELGVSASGVHLSDNNNFGVGARAVFNLNSFFSLEGEGNFLLNDAPPNSSVEDAPYKGCLAPRSASEWK